MAVLHPFSAFFNQVVFCHDVPASTLIVVHSTIYAIPVGRRNQKFCFVVIDINSCKKSDNSVHMHSY